MNENINSKANEIKIVYEDENVMVINKPFGITVNKADTTKNEITVQDWAEEKLQIKRGVKVSNVSEVSIGDTFFERGGIVHRLDKETSGALIIAKNPEAFVELQRQFKERITKKVYLALAHGKIVPEEGIINAPVGRLPWNRRQFGVVAGGREAVTKYKVIQHYKWGSDNDFEVLSLVELYPETGRTHQIRVHLKYLGYPIFGDFLYAGRKTQRDDRKVLSRVFLHASKISFQLPGTGEWITCECPLAEELQETLESLS